MQTLAFGADRQRGVGSESEEGRQRSHSLWTWLNALLLDCSAKQRACFIRLGLHARTAGERQSCAIPKFKTARL